MIKKLIMISCVLGFAGFQIAGATSGACSNHGGVNCKVVSAMDGSAICNDGWVSSAQYSAMAECQQTTSPSYCLPPIVAPTTQGDCNLLWTQGYESGAAEYNPTFQSSVIAPCENAIINYQAQELAYQTCLNSQSTQIKPTPIVVPLQPTIENNTSSPILCLYGTLDQATHDQAVSDLTTLTQKGNYDQAVSDAGALATKMMNDASQTLNEAMKILGSGANADYVLAMVKQREYNAQLNILKGKISCPIGSPITTSATQSSATSATSLPTTIVSSSISLPPNISIAQNLQVGTSGQNVINLQRFLESKGFLTLPAETTEGYFGSLTKQALAAFQKANGLPATGYCGPMTRSAINNAQ